MKKKIGKTNKHIPREYNYINPPKIPKTKEEELCTLELNQKLSAGALKTDTKNPVQTHQVSKIFRCKYECGSTCLLVSGSSLLVLSSPSNTIGFSFWS